MKSDAEAFRPYWKKGIDAANAAPRCGAKKRRKGTPCGSPAMANGRCRIHGGLSTGPKTEEGIERIRQAHWEHGQRSAEAVKRRKQGAALRREIKLIGTLLDGVDQRSSGP